MEFNSINFDKFMELLYSVFMFQRAYEPLEDQMHKTGQIEHLNRS